MSQNLSEDIILVFQGILKKTISKALCIFVKNDGFHCICHMFDKKIDINQNFIPLAIPSKVIILNDKDKIKQYYETDCYDIDKLTIIPIIPSEICIGVILLIDSKIDEIGKYYNIIVKTILEKEKLNMEFQKLNIKNEDAFKTIFLGNLAHEVRTPLNGIVGYSQLLLQSTVNTTQKNFLTSLNDCSMQLLQIMNDILDFAKLSNNKVVINENITNIKDLLNIVENTLYNKILEKNHKLNIIIEPKTPVCILTDKQKIIQILINLISNANKFTNIGGKITVTVRLDKEFIIFSIVDTGIGIAQDDQVKLFNSFVQIEKSKFKSGTGLGLFIAKKLTNLLGGDISVNSVLGKGSTFTFSVKYLPYNNEEISNEEDIELLSDLQILIVDDNADNRLLLTEMLYEFNMKPIVCGSALEAIRVVLGNRYHVKIGLIDIHMPNISGIELAKQIKEEMPDFKMIALSSYDTFINSSEFETRLDKPVNKSILVSEIINVLKNKTVNKPKNSNKNIKFLIAEDITYNSTLLIDMLNVLGYTNIVTAFNGEEAIKEIQIAESIKDPIQILLLDLLMPKMSGFEVMNIIKKHKWEIKIIITTASVMEESKIKCKEFGIKHFINKPIVFRELKDCILNCI